jgi:subtilisin family serine protease
VGTNVLSTYKTNKYAIMSGTSMSTAVVSGIIHARGSLPRSTSNTTCPAGSANSYPIAIR